MLILESFRVILPQAIEMSGKIGIVHTVWVGQCQVILPDVVMLGEEPLPEPQLVVRCFDRQINGFG